MDSMYRFLTELGADPFKRQAYLKTPTVFFDDAELSAAERAFLADRRSAPSATELAGAPWTPCAGCGDPGYDPIDYDYDVPGPLPGPQPRRRQLSL